MIQKPNKDNKLNTFCKCQCVCGNIVNKSYSDLKRSSIVSCGCRLYERNEKQVCNMTGRRFGRLTVLSDYRSDQKHRRLLCKCERHT